MTALKEFERLEATALWRETLATQRREVYVSFGNTSLMIRDKNDAALSHWSLPAVRRLNPGQEPAIFSPNVEGTETLEFSDPTMIAAIEKVRAAIERRRPHPGRLRLLIFAGLTAAIALLSVIWFPDALVRHTSGVVPLEKRAQIGRELLGHITRLSGKECQTARGTTALRRLQKRVVPDGTKTLLVLRDGVVKSAHLPGGLILLNKALVEDFEGPEVVAGYSVLERERMMLKDPLTILLQEAGLRETFRLLTTGSINSDALRAYAQRVLTAEPLQPSDDLLLERFANVGFSSAPFAYEIDPSGEETLALIEADPFRGKTYAPLLSDPDWVGLQGICGG